MALTIEMVFWTVSTIASITAVFITLNNYSVNERVRMFGHD